MSAVVWTSAVWADSLNEYCMEQFACLDDLLEHAFDFGATADGVTLDLSRSDAAARRMVSVELPAGRGAVPYPVMAVAWDGSRWVAAS